MSPRVVLDTNIRFSAFAFRGAPALLLVLLRTAGFLEIVSPPLVDEFEDVLERKSYRAPEAIAAEIADLLERALLVEPNEHIHACRDEDDNRILECAVAGQADYIVTGDRDLLVLGSFRGIPILTARQFLDHLQRPD